MVVLVIVSFIELAAMFAFILYSNGHHQSRAIAQQLCSGFPAWRAAGNSSDSWCQPSIFDTEFRVEVQCPCFLPKK